MAYGDRLRRSPAGVRALTRTTPGAFDDPSAQFPPRYAAAEAERPGDLGYPRGVTTGPPPKRPEGEEPPPERKARDRRLSRRRAAAEHGIGEVTIWRIAADDYRCPRRRRTPVYGTVAGQHSPRCA